jgi:plastocyanin
VSASLRIAPAIVSVAAGVLLAAGCGGKDTAPRAPAAAARATDGAIAAVAYPGVQHQHYRYGPIQITPGQNTIVYRPTTNKPRVAGYITRFHPDLVYTNGRKPAVDVLHLHHGVWQMRDYPTFAAGEEKTITQFPRGFGYRYAPRDRWVLNYMLHNLEPTRARVYLTWDVDFVPEAAAAAAGIKEVQPLWLDVGDGNYPVFDAQRGWGSKGRYTFPDDARGAERAKIGPQQHVRVPMNITLVAAGGHVHPGGLWVDLRSSRGTDTKTVFRSEAKYYEPAGAVSWDVSMTVTPPDWRVQVRKGDVLSVSGTYDTKRASWYESMAIMPTMFDPGGTGNDPFTTNVDVEGTVTHGHLPENNGHGGSRLTGLPDPRELLSRPMPANGKVAIQDFVYGQGDLSSTGRRGRPVRVRAGRRLTFVNRDAGSTIYHTITACRAPCNRTTGIAYPLADGKVDFDSGELGFGPAGFTAAANRASWKTPKRLAAGTYTYFCRVHPFMRGAFKVKSKR